MGIPTNKYDKALAEMYDLRRFGIKLGLETIRSGLSNLNNPHHNYNCIHIAGTNGKGSIASGIASILFQAGYKVGLYTSPHLVQFNERICINTKPITHDRVVCAFEQVKKAHDGEREYTFFEFATAMALWEFNAQKVDWAIIETGMGGRLDATNIIFPKISIISNISIEHQAYLGQTLKEITFEKAGIIKDKTPVITGVKQKTAVQTIEKVAKERKAPLFRMGNSFRLRRHKDNSFSYFGTYNQWRNLKTNLAGAHQIENAGLVLAAVEVLIQNNKLDISQESIKKGLETNLWPGRLELLSTSPAILLDGAHNITAIKRLAQHLKIQYANRRIILIIGILDDKPFKAMLECLIPNVSKTIITQPESDRSIRRELLFTISKGIKKGVECVTNVEAAVVRALEIADPKDLICITGSLYVVGDAKIAIKKLSESASHSEKLRGTLDN